MESHSGKESKLTRQPSVHTFFMQRKGYTIDKLPRFDVQRPRHFPEPCPGVDEEAAGGGRASQSETAFAQTIGDSEAT